MRQNFVYVPSAYASNATNDKLVLDYITFGFGDALPTGDPQQVDLMSKDSTGVISTVGSYMITSQSYIQGFNVAFDTQLGGQLVWVQSKGAVITGAKGLTCTLKFVRVKSRCYTSEMV